MQVFSRHPTHDILRGKLKFPVRTVVRFGSITEGKNKFAVEINTPAAVQISFNKRLMKQAFDRAGIPTAKWYPDLKAFIETKDKIHYPVIVKNIFGSRGKGNHLFTNKKEIKAFLEGKTVENYIFEQFYSFNREYRLHITRDGCFYTCRKMLKSDTPTDKRWFRNDSNSVWILEENTGFDKPLNWDSIVGDCVKGLQEIGLDVGAFDVRVQSTKDKDGNKRDNPEYIIIESNSAPSFGDITAQKYLETLEKLIKEKIETELIPNINKNKILESNGISSTDNLNTPVLEHTDGAMEQVNP